MLVTLLRERRWMPLAILTAGVLIHALMWTGLIGCPRMSPVACLATALTVVAAASVTGILARAAWLAHRTARALAALPRIPLPAPAVAAAERTGTVRISCVPGAGLTAFCAGLWRPRLYLTDTTATMLPSPQLDAVLLHEAAHARRRDPLRRLLGRAAADILFYLPLAHWWSGHQIQHSELYADRAAISRLGARPVAAALLAAGTTPPPATTGFQDALDARIAQLADDPLPTQQPGAKPVVLSLTGLVLTISLAMCLGQTALGL